MRTQILFASLAALNWGAANMAGVNALPRANLALRDPQRPPYYGYNHPYHGDEHDHYTDPPEHQDNQPTEITASAGTLPGIDDSIGLSARGTNLERRQLKNADYGSGSNPVASTHAPSASQPTTAATSPEPAAATQTAAAR